MNGGVIVSCDRVDVSATRLELAATPPVVSCDRVDVSATPAQLSTAFIRQIPGFFKKPGICGAR